MKKRNSLKNAIKGIGEAIEKRKNSRQLIDDDYQDFEHIPRPDGFDDAGAEDIVESLSDNVFDLDNAGISAHDSKFNDFFEQAVRTNNARYGNNSVDPWGSSKKFQKYYQRACEQGNREAQYVVGVCYQFGVQPDLDPCHDAALKWYLSAAKQGCSRSINNIGTMIYQNLAGFAKKNDQLAIQFFEQAARHGIREAEMNMTVLLTLSPDNAVQDRARAFLLLSRICQREFVSRQALNNLGCMYLRGFGCTADSQRAMELFERSARMGCQVAKYNIGILYLNGLGVKKDRSRAGELIAASSADKEHEDYPCIEQANDLTKLLMFTTMNSCL